MISASVFSCRKTEDGTLFITAKDNVAAWVNGKPVLVESPMGNFGRARDPWGYFRVIPVGQLLNAGANSLGAEAMCRRIMNGHRKLVHRAPPSRDAGRQNRTVSFPDPNGRQGQSKPACMGGTDF